MPAKSRRKKGKYIPQRKPQTNVTARQSTATPQQSVARTSAVASKPPMAVTKESGSRLKTPQGSTQMTTPASYSTISREIKTISIMGGTLLIVLIVIAIFLS